MTESAQKRAIESYRKRLRQNGLMRFEVMGTPVDRDLIRAIARRLAAGGDEAERLRVVVKSAVAGVASGSGGILAALRRSPLVGADLDVTREGEAGRPVDL